MPTAVVGYGLYLRLSVCLCLFFRTISKKPMQLGSPNLTKKCSKMRPVKLFILGSKMVKGHKSQKALPEWFFAFL